MSYGKVIPIDAEVARQLERRQTRFRVLVGVLVAAWLAILVPAVLLTPLPPLGPFLVLAALVVIAEHRSMLFGDETSMSANVLVVITSVFVLGGTSPLAGPLMVASLACVYLPHIRNRAVTLAVANAAIFGVSGALAAVAIWIIRSRLPPAMPLPLSFCIAAAASCVYWYANSALTGIASALRHDSPLFESIKTQALSEWPVLLLATACGLAAMQATNIAQVILILVTGISMFAICLTASTRQAPRMPLRANHGFVFAAALGAVMCHRGMVAGAIAILAIFCATTLLNPRPANHLWSLCFAASGITTSLLLARAGVPPVAQFLGLFTVGLVAIHPIWPWPRSDLRAALPIDVRLGLLVPGTADLALMMAIVAGQLLGSHLAATSALICVIALAIRQFYESAPRRDRAANAWNH